MAQKPKEPLTQEDRDNINNFVLSQTGSSSYLLTRKGVELYLELRQQGVKI